MRTRDDKRSDKTLSGAAYTSSAARRLWCAGSNVASRPGRRLASIFSLLLAFTLAGASFATCAGTNVSGPITANSTWSVAGAPYTVTGDVTVNGGAVLTVEAGVVVYMNAGTNLVVNNGALSAIGSANAPIVITSYRDIVNPSPAPAPGDWGQLKFLSGTLAGTSLNYVQIKYGSGVAMTAASPALNNVSILNHNTPAISIDLQSSPVGSGLAATGNTLNGILVPAGDITGNVNWGLAGIPYVVAQGIVGVGAPPISISPSTLSLNANTTGTLHVAVANAAPAGGIVLSVSSSVPAAATVPPTVTVPQGGTTVDVTVTGVASGTSTITVSGTGLGSATATVQVNSAPALMLSPGVATVGVGQTLPMTVTASLAAPAGGLAVALSSANTNFVTVPTPVTIAANQTTAGFNATGVAPGASTITAQASGYTNGTATITAQALAISVPANLLVAPGLTVGLAVTLPGPAPAGGLTVNLHSANTAIATVPASVSVAAGATTASVNVTGVAVGNTTITASATGYTSGVTNVAVSGITLDVQPSGTINIPQGVTQAYQIKLSAAAPAGGVTVNVVSNGTSTATVSPASVTIAQGQTLSTATIAVQGVATGSTTLTLSSSGLSSKIVNVSVLAQGRLAFSRTAETVGKGLSTSPNYLAVQLLAGTNDFVSPVPVTVTLTSSDPTKASVPVSVTIPAFTTNGAFSVTGVNLTTTPITIDAGSSAGYVAPATKLSANVVAPQLLFQLLDGARALGHGRDNFYVQWSVPGSSDTGQRSAIDTNVNLTVTNSSPVGIIGAFYDQLTGGNIVSQVTIAAGQFSSAGTNGAWTYVGEPTALGSYSVTASVPNLTTSTSAVQIVATATLEFSVSNMTVGKGLRTYPFDIYLRRTLNGQPFSDPNAVTVNLVSSDPTKVTVPASITIPAFQNQLAFQVTGTDLTTAPVTIDATTAGYASPATKLSATVVLPQLRLSSLPGTRTLVSPRDYLTVNWYVPTTTNSTFQLSVVDAVVNLAITDQNPLGIVNGFYDQLTGGNLVAQATIPAGQNGSNNVFVGVPTAAGSYTVTASVPGVATTVSPTQTVNGPALSFGFGNTVLGQGLSSDVILNRSNDNLAPLTVNLACQPSTLCSVAPTLNLPAGISSATVRVTGVGLGSGSLQASAPGYTSASGGIEVYIATLQFNFPSIVVGKTLTTLADITLSRTLNNVLFSGDALVVTLANSDPTKLSLPATVTIPSNDYQVQFAATGLNLTTTAVSIGAAAANYQPPAPMSATVVAPQLGLGGLAGTRTVNSARDDFSVSWYVPGNTGTNPAQRSTAGTAVNVTITDQNPAGIVTGIYDQASGGNLISSLTIPAGANTGAALGWIGQPTTLGTYTVTASAPAVTSTVSALQSVGLLLTFSAVNTAVGQGLYTDLTLNRAGDNSTAFLAFLQCLPSTMCSVAGVGAGGGPGVAFFLPGSSNTAVRITGIGLGSGAVVASASGYTNAIVAVDALPATFGFSGLPGALTVNGTANFTVFAYPLQGGPPVAQPPAAAVVVTLASTSPAVASVLPSSVTIPAGATSSSTSAQIRGLAPGTTTVTATSPSYVPGTSGTINVGP